MGMKVNKQLPLPSELKEEYPMSKDIVELKRKRDKEIRDIFTGKSDKFAVIIGPCSADNEDSVCEYVNRLAKVNEKVKDKQTLRLAINEIYARHGYQFTAEEYTNHFNQFDWYKNMPKEADMNKVSAGFSEIEKKNVEKLQAYSNTKGWS